MRQWNSTVSCRSNLSYLIQIGKRILSLLSSKCFQIIITKSTVYAFFEISKHKKFGQGSINSIFMEFSFVYWLLLLFVCKNYSNGIFLSIKIEVHVWHLNMTHNGAEEHSLHKHKHGLARNFNFHCIIKRDLFLFHFTIKSTCKSKSQLN